MVYTASHLSLAVLESFVHLPGSMRTSAGLPEMVSVCLSVPSAQIAQLDRDLGASGEDARAIGDRWLTDRPSLALEVPSAVVPNETNVLINPDHPEMRAVRVVSQTPFLYDPRLVEPH